MNFKIFIKDIANNMVHEARKIIWSENPNDISFWSNTWDGRHILDHRCSIERIEFGTDTNVLTKKDVKDTNVLNIDAEKERQINEIVNLLHENSACLNICAPLNYCGVYIDDETCKECLCTNLFRLFNCA